jgi:hypothetical protein
MLTAPTRTEDTFTGRRVTIKTIRSFDDITTRLYASVGTLTDAGWPSITSYLEASPTKEGFVAAAKPFIGPELFMLFWRLTIVSGHHCMEWLQGEGSRE